MIQITWFGRKNTTLNAHNFKTKPLIDKWTTPSDRAFKNTPFLKKMTRAPPYPGLFIEDPDRNLTKKWKPLYNIFMLKVIMSEALLIADHHVHDLING